MSASNDNLPSSTPAPRGDDGWRCTTVTLDTKEFFSSVTAVEKLLGGITHHSAKDRLFARFHAELAANDSPAFMMREARKNAVRIHRQAASEKIDLYGNKWVAPERFGNAATTLTSLFNGLNVSHIYRDWQSVRTDRLVATLARNPYFHRIVREWHKSAPGTQAAYAQWISRHHQSIFAERIAPARKIRVGTVSVPRNDERLTLGDHRAPEPGKTTHRIRLNMHPDAELHQVAKALNVIFHENTHAVHDMLATALVNGKIDSDHPLYNDARLLLLATQEHYGYITGIKSVYRAHPTEEDTFRASDAFVEKMTAALAPYKITLEPRAREIPRTPHYVVLAERYAR